MVITIWWTKVRKIYGFERKLNHIGAELTEKNQTLNNICKAFQGFQKIHANT